MEAGAEGVATLRSLPFLAASAAADKFQPPLPVIADSVSKKLRC